MDHPSSQNYHPTIERIGCQRLRKPGSSCTLYRFIFAVFSGNCHLPSRQTKPLTFSVKISLKYVTPSETYEIVSPFLQAVDEHRTPSQIADKAFESKSRLVLMSYLQRWNIVFEELEREIKRDGVTICEWEGTFRLATGEFIFLKCKTSDDLDNYLPYLMNWFSK